MSKSTIAQSAGWLLVSLALALAAIVTLAGTGQQESPASVRAQTVEVAVPGGSGIRPMTARAETDTLDLQLD
jgi:hypothetical protein